ncbi:MAG: response regulator [Candidatus Gribaldobacteria bacterium]|nr:response regulator [Candidatus Gribaldobacteria bacterium]
MGKRPTQTKKLNKGRILLIEDEENLINIYRDFFESNDYTLTVTKDIKEAMGLTELEKPDVVLLDVIIPKEENNIITLVSEQGYNYLAMVKNNPKTKDIPIVVFTNLDTSQDRQKSQEMGAAAYIFKRDCTPKEVLDTIEKVIGIDHK